MNNQNTDHIVKAASELGEAYTESAELLSGMSGAMYEYDQLYDHGYDGAGNSMIKFGIALIMIPEPFLVTDLIGGGIVAAGMLYKKFIPPPMYINTIFDTIQEQVKAIHTTGENLSQNFSISVDFSSMHFEI